MAKGGNSGGSGGGGFFRTVLTLALLGLVGYNTYEMQTMKQELAALQKTHGMAHATARSTTDAPPPESSPDGGAVDLALSRSAELLHDARGQLAQAEQNLHLKRYEDARDQLAMAAQTFQRANASTRAEGDKILAQLRGAADQLSKHDNGKNDDR